MSNCAPAIGSFVPLGSSTTMLSVTVSPGLASTVSIFQSTAPSGSVVVEVEVDVVDVVVLDVVVVLPSTDVVVVTSVVVVVVVFLTMIAPSSRFTLPVISLPLVSLMKALDHLTGYSPSAQSSGTV